MNAKKLLSLVLALVMACSVMATLTVTASAGASNTCTYDSAEKAITVQLIVPTKLTIGSTPEPIEMTVDGSFCDCTAHYLKQDVAYYEGYDQEVYTAYNNYLWLPEDTVSAAVTYAYCVFGEMKNSTDFANVELTVNGQTCELIAVDDYYFYFFVVIGTTDANGNITGTAPNECYLDLESSTTDILDSKELDQNYNLTVEEGTKTDVTKVKLTWTISDINAVRADNKIWDTTELKWVDVAGTPTVTDNGTATFKLENYSSVKVDAAVTFDTAEYEEGKKFTAPTLTFDEITGTDGKITLDTANGNETYSKTNVPTGTIHVTVTPVADDFKSLNATTSAAKYGTYTVTISKSAESRTLYIAQSGGGWAVSSVTVNGQTVPVTKTRDSDGYITVTEGDEVVVSLSQERICYAYSTATESPLDDDPSNVMLTASNSDPRTSAAFTVPDLSGVVGLVFSIAPMPT